MGACQSVGKLQEKRRAAPMSTQNRAAGIGWQHKAGLVLFGLLLATVSLTGLEVALRFLGIGDELLFGDPFVGFATGRDLFEQKRLEDGSEIFSTRAEKLAYFNDQQFTAAKDPSTYRIFALGGSTTAGRPYDHSVSFSAFLERYLRAADPKRRWEVINAGAISYASYRIVLLMKELARYEPDLFVVYTGHNEFLEERAYPPIIHRSLTAKRAWIWLNGLRSYGLGRYFVGRLRPSKGDDDARAGTVMAAEVSAKPDDWTGVERYHRDDDLRRAIVEHFEFNLHQMAAIARSAGAEILFIQPISNLKDFSPFKSEHSSHLDPEDLALFERSETEAAALVDQGAFEAALPLLEEATRLDPRFAEAQFRLGRVLLALDRTDEAGAAFVRAKEEDITPLRALEEMVAAVGATGTALGIPTIDLPAVLEAENRQRLGHSLLGSELLLDHVHPDIPVHARIAEEILAVLTDRDIARPGGAWTDKKINKINGEILGSVDRYAYAQRDLNLAKVLGWAGKVAEAEEPLRRAAQVLTDNPEVHLSLGVVLVKSKRWDEALGALLRALELDPTSPKVHFNLGLVHNSRDDTEAAIDAFQTAIRYQPEYPEALYNLGVLELRREPKNALRALRSALAAKPGAVETLVQLGFAHRHLNELPQARASFERALELDPNNSGARAGLGGTLARQGALAAAEEMLREAIAQDPEQVEAHYDLGLLLARTNRGSEALDQYRRAIEHDSRFAPALNNLGVALGAQGETRAAIDYFERAVAAAPSFAEAHFNLGVAYAQIGRPAEAVESIQTAIGIEPESGRFHLALGMLLLAGGPGDTALFHLRRAEALGVELPAKVRAALAASQ